MRVVIKGVQGEGKIVLLRAIATLVMSCGASAKYFSETVNIDEHLDVEFGPKTQGYLEEWTRRTENGLSQEPALPGEEFRGGAYQGSQANAAEPLPMDPTRHRISTCKDRTADFKTGMRCPTCYPKHVHRYESRYGGAQQLGDGITLVCACSASVYVHPEMPSPFKMPEPFGWGWLSRPGDPSIVQTYGKEMSYWAHFDYFDMVEHSRKEMNDVK